MVGRVGCSRAEYRGVESGKEVYIRAEQSIGIVCVMWCKVEQRRVWVE